ncbi:hypothetical protein Y032_0371g143 [Ancylostoma ceylanicum]|nr:hypothetical protein Y032_0371g143 [Ancylostoma ceylanicum]
MPGFCTDFTIAGKELLVEKVHEHACVNRQISTFNLMQNTIFTFPESNAWQCVCGEEWLGEWLEKAGDSDVGDGVLGCLVTAARRCAVDPQVEKDEARSAWVTVTASILAAVSLLILIAIAFLYISDGKQRVVLMRPLSRRTNSDLHKLIADVDPLIARDMPPRKPTTGDKKRVRFEDN